MKSLDIPLIGRLDIELPTDEILNLLDTDGVRDAIDCVNWPGLFPYEPLTTFTAAHDGRNIYIDFFTRCNYLRAENFEPQSPVSQDSCVEFFVAPRDDGRYWNFEFNCIGTINASNRTDRPHPTRLSADELSRIRVYPSCGKRPFCELEGLFSWNLLVIIPFDLICVKFDGKPQTMRANFYKCASATAMPHYLSWNPIKTERPDFHRPEFFGRITFNSAEG